MQAFTSQNLGTLGIWKYKETCYHPEHAGMDSALRHGAFRLVGLARLPKLPGRKLEGVSTKISWKIFNKATRNQYLVKVVKLLSY